MGSDERPRISLESSYARELVGLYTPWRAAPVPRPELLVLNDSLAAELDLDADTLRAPGGVALLVGNAVPDGATPLAQAYAGHQFGGYSPRLGDGRALLVGEIVDRHGHRRDLHLKGSGPTPYARGGDGRAAVGPMLREYAIGEAMHALGIPTTRALAVVATGEQIARTTMLPGAVLCRIAASHLRVGTFQFAASRGDPQLVRRLADYAIARHDPSAATAARPYLTFLEGVIDAQASLVARWMLVGFVHGVMNTDNVTISGETIDYGPCAFMEAYDPATVFSSIDHRGRYAYGNQPSITQWNLARLAETLLPLIDADSERAIAAVTDSLQSFPGRYQGYFRRGMLAKLGLVAGDPADATLIDPLLALMQARRVDYTSGMRALSSLLRDDDPRARALFGPGDEFDRWVASWRRAVSGQRRSIDAIAATMDRINPIYIPRNHTLEEALSTATGGDLGPFRRLLEVIVTPFDRRPGLDEYAAPAADGAAPFRTFCGT